LLPLSWCNQIQQLGNIEYTVVRIFAVNQPIYPVALHIELDSGQGTSERRQVGEDFIILNMLVVA
jgi:hypothetical protein